MANLQDAKDDARRILATGQIDDPERFKRLLAFLKYHSRKDPEVATLFTRLISFAHSHSASINKITPRGKETGGQSCAYHPGCESKNTCCICHNHLCDECSQPFADKFICAPCKSAYLLQLRTRMEQSRGQQANRPLFSLATILGRLLGFVIVLLIVVAGGKVCFSGTGSSAQNPAYVYIDGGIVIGSDGKPIELADNPNAANPTYSSLMSFLKSDFTDTKDYYDFGKYGGYRCTEFARDLHNNAEAAGIKAGFVAIEFLGEDIGHAINVFETTDRGLVYIDCTGASILDSISGYLHQGSLLPIAGSYDTVAYIESGKPYGRVNIDYAKSTSYQFYALYIEKCNYYEELLEVYNREVAQFNQDIRGKTYYIGTPEWSAMKSREASLDAQEQVLENLEAELGDCWFPAEDVVEKSFIRW